MFRRRRLTSSEAAAEAPLEAAGPAREPAGTTGPYDSASAPADDVPRVDLGSLLVPTPAGTELRLEANEAQEVSAAVLVVGSSALQLGVFAAPRSEGIWAEVRGEILSSLSREGGRGREVDGDFGVELAAELPGTGGRQPARFVGVDGPRWFLRGLFTGPAAATVGPDRRLLETALREVVVVRGEQAMPVRDPLPLRLPPEALATAGQPGPSTAPDEPAAPPELPERGPEITETR